MSSSNNLAAPFDPVTLATAGQDPPAWAQTLLQAVKQVVNEKFDRMEERLIRFEERLDRTDEKSNKITQEMERISCLSKKNNNSFPQSGDSVPFQIIPLADGSLPTDHTRQNGERFPPIFRAKEIRGMDRDCLEEYLDLYGLRPNPDLDKDNLEVKRLRLARGIGAYQVNFNV
ncbi:hypothetical protein BOTBODRAFT_35419 [Botryobasidium botryosum FD-172 SS1]|uniref:Mug135-like C-terminal domain-containing protein n=1 Tax=Botryobasidium botryosum (strain FD-172 SS1) TaxID=930990 RepID=A0A067MIH6_BOTB1|nr:hypothetical protein BOTBODRAFT_35419 [Botryobasidium botryosum FD-172 SS1]